MSVKLDTIMLDQLIKAFNADAAPLPKVRVGILGAKDARPNDPQGGKTNAEIGVIHEFGTSKLPVRSFLRMPLNENLAEFLEKKGAFDEKTLKKVIADGSITEWMTKIGIVAEEVIAEAFSTGGFGQWKPSEMAHKKNHETLVETTQLRDSITSEVK